MFLVYKLLTSLTTIFQLQKSNMLSKLLIPSFLSSAPTKKQDKKTCPWAKVFLQHVKTYKKTGIKLREAMLINPDGTVVARDGDVQGLSDIDIMVSTGTTAKVQGNTTAIV